MKTTKFERFEMNIPVQSLLTFLAARFPEMGPRMECLVVTKVNPLVNYNTDSASYPVKSVEIHVEKRELVEEPAPEGHSVNPTEPI